LLAIRAGQQAGEPSQVFGPMLALFSQVPALLDTYAHSARANLAANGTATLYRKSASSQTLSGSFALTGAVDLAAAEGLDESGAGDDAPKLLSLTVTAVDLVLPNRPDQVNHLYTHGGQPVLTIDLLQDLDISVHGAAQ